jgi:hemerythrin-like domain-containing protein
VSGALYALGRRAAGEPSLVALLADCHARIRIFTALAVKLGEERAPEAERREAAERLHRYFTIALPLHVADEEQSLRPRLDVTAPPELARALAAMAREHDAHDALLAPLLAAWDALGRGAPADVAALSPLARALERATRAHLEAEERILFPAAARLPARDQHAIVSELRARRATSH